MDRIKKYSDKIIGVVVVCIVLVSYIFIGCPIKRVTGVSCMGCGMTRAFWSLATLHFKESFYYHPLWPLVLAWIPIFIFRDKINKKLFKVFVGITIAAFIVVWILRMMDGHNHIVVFQPSKSIIGRLFQ